MDVNIHKHTYRSFLCEHRKRTRGDAYHTLGTQRRKNVIKDFTHQHLPTHSHSHCQHRVLLT